MHLIDFMTITSATIHISSAMQSTRYLQINVSKLQLERAFFLIMSWQRMDEGHVCTPSRQDILDLAVTLEVRAGRTSLLIEQGARPTQHTAVGNWSLSPEEPKAERNQLARCASVPGGKK